MDIGHTDTCPLLIKYDKMNTLNLQEFKFEEKIFPSHNLNYLIEKKVLARPDPYENRATR